MSGRGPGRLVLVFGPSGAGKDSVLGAAEAQIPAGSRIVFAQRSITRPAEAGGEVHEPLSWPEFSARRAAGRFLLSWEANGNGYGIPDLYARQLAAGLTVVASVSRTVIADAACLGVPVVPVRITAPIVILAERLARRGREGEAEIAARLSRAALREPVLGVPVNEIVNDGTLAEAGARFLRIVADAQPANG